jgi:hypothetical protein
MTMGRRGVHTREVLHDECSQTNIWPKRNEFGFSRGRWSYLLFEPSRPRKPRHQSPSTKCCFAPRARLGRSLYQLELPLLQFITEHGQMLGVAIA